ncbi:zf-CCHC_4 domain-containing protein, partial [Cephalotus follicularis]
YERLPVFCYFCGCLGHQENECNSAALLKKKKRTVEWQYGPWLWVEGYRHGEGELLREWAMEEVANDNDNTGDENTDIDQDPMVIKESIGTNKEVDPLSKDETCITASQTDTGQVGNTEAAMRVEADNVLGVYMKVLVLHT